MTYLAVPITAGSLEQAKADIARALGDGAECIELRLDYLGNPSATDVTSLIAAVKEKVPVIATCRPIWEGGQFAGQEQQRLTLLRQAAIAAADYIDLELESLKDHKIPSEFQDVKLIISNHDFEHLPRDFRQRLYRLRQYQPNIPKFAYMPGDITDCLTALDMLHENPGAIAMAMGPAGTITRLLAKKLGAFLTFASLSGEKESAPGQINLRQMKQLYRWDAIGRDTRLYGVIGHPIGHSLSPHIHNRSFDHTGFNGLYIPLLIDPKWEVFQAFMDGIMARKWLDFRGLSVTIPHKHHALDYVRQKGGRLETLAGRIGAVNTLIIDDAGQISGYNSDYAGAMDAITDTLGIERADLKGIPTAVIGAGGVSRAIVAGLIDVNAQVTIYNRTVEKAKNLAADFNCQWKPLTEIQNLDAKIIINCTSIGMHPHMENTPVPGELLKPDMTVFDTVYNPKETRLLKEAKEAGAKTVNGQTMFINQAAIQFQLFTGQRPPKDIMQEVLK
ncbi:MAG: shikimate dehydrogenase [Sedimentisphaerales bacterium]|nr:shikimate dehydrogenase [Sedimentisphaerales bacterium]